LPEIDVPVDKVPVQCYNSHVCFDVLNNDTNMYTYNMFILLKY